MDRYTLLATVPVNNYTDSALQADNWYRVTAVNAIGETPYCGEFHPETIILPDPCTLPGVQVTSDFNPDGTDKDSGANTPVDPRVNARQLYVGEPFFGERPKQAHVHLTRRAFARFHFGAAEQPMVPHLEPHLRGRPPMDRIESTSPCGRTPPAR